MIAVLGIVSCKGKRQMLTGTWHAVKLENPDMDTFFINSQHYIDTIGKNNSEDANLQLYGVANVDSLRRVLQAQYDTAKAMQMNAVVNTVFSFRADSMAFLTFNGIPDSARWYMDKDDKLILDDLQGQGTGEKVNMEIVELTDVALKLRFKEDNAFSTVTFRREGK